MYGTPSKQLKRLFYITLSDTPSKDLGKGSGIASKALRIESMNKATLPFPFTLSTHGNQKVTLNDVSDMVRMRSMGMTLNAIGIAKGCTGTTVHNYLNGKFLTAAKIRKVSKSKNVWKSLMAFKA